jgi:tetratricopeptide (TPR) repeat protein
MTGSVAPNNPIRAALFPMPVSSQPPRVSAWEWIQTALLLVNLAWTTLCLGGFRPETMVVTSAWNGLLLAVHLAGRSLAEEGSRRRAHPAGWWMLPFLIYAAANVLWVTPVPWLGWRDWLGWAQMILVFWVVLNGIRSTPTRTALFGGLVLLAFVAVGLACYQRFVKPDWLMMGRTQANQFIGRASGSFGIPNSLAALLLLLIPPLAVLTLRRGAGVLQRLLCGYLTLTLVFGLVLTISRGAYLAFALVLAAWPAFAARGPWWRRAGLVVLAGLAVMVALGVLYFAAPKVRERIMQMKVDAGERTRPIMWRGAWLIFRDHPAWGGGAGSYNVLFEKYRPEGYQDEPLWPHDDYLNTLSDYGTVGFVLFFGVGGLVVWRCLRERTPRTRDWLDEPAVAGAMVAGMAAFGLQLLLEFHFKIPALAMAFAMIAALLVQRAWPAGDTAAPASPVRRAGDLLAALAVLLTAGFWVFPYYRSEALRYGARQSINRLAMTEPSPAVERETLSLARADLARAVRIAPANAQAWADLSYATSLWAHTEPAQSVELGREAERMASRAIALSKVVPEFWLRRGVAFDLQGRQSEAGADFVQALMLAPANAHVWFYEAYHLGLNQSDVAMALAAVDFCLRLDPGNREAQSLRQRLASSRPAP